MAASVGWQCTVCGEIRLTTSEFQNHFCTGPSQHEQEEKEFRVKHPFSEPWDDSDLILVVGEEKFHVHRQIMSIHSPVFKAMLNTVGYKEATATEIPLPGKKADEFLDFLKLLYLKEKKGIELNKMGHILRLADEYQAEGVHDFCVKTLRDMSKSKDNAVKIFFLTTQTAMARDDERLGHVRSQCREIIKNMDLANIKGSSDFQNLNRDDYESLLEKRIRRLETFVSQIYPQFIGLVEYCLYLGLECELPGLTCCPVHFPGGTSKVTIGLPGRIGNCSVCQKIIQTMVKRSRTFQRKTSVSSFRTQVKREHVHVYGGEHHFDTAVISIVNDFTEVRDNLQGGKSPGFRL